MSHHDAPEHTTHPHHDVHGIPTKKGDAVLYTSAASTRHASRLKHIKTDEPGHKAALYVHHSVGGESHVEDVPYDPAEAPHTWRHLPELPAEE